MSIHQTQTVLEESPPVTGNEPTRLTHHDVALLLDFYQTLDVDARRERFNGGVSNEAIAEHCLAINWGTTIVMAWSAAGSMTAVAELHLSTSTHPTIELALAFRGSQKRLPIWQQAITLSTTEPVRRGCDVLEVGIYREAGEVDRLLRSIGEVHRCGDTFVCKMPPQTRGNGSVPPAAAFKPTTIAALLIKVPLAILGTVCVVSAAQAYTLQDYENDHDMLQRQAAQCEVQTSRHNAVSARVAQQGIMPPPPPPCTADIPRLIAGLAQDEAMIFNLTHPGAHASPCNFVVNGCGAVRYGSNGNDNSRTDFDRDVIRGNSIYLDEDGGEHELPRHPYVYRNRNTGQIFGGEQPPPNNGTDWEMLTPCG
jgi:hypothetical protein